MLLVMKILTELYNPKCKAVCLFLKNVTHNFQFLVFTFQFVRMYLFEPPPFDLVIANKRLIIQPVYFDLFVRRHHIGREFEHGRK